MVLIAHNIRSLYNVGSFFRIADAFDVEKVYLTGYTGVPPHKEIAKVALGSEHRVPWEHRDEIGALVKELKAGGVKILALETGPNVLVLDKATQKYSGDSIALILGNEVTGIEPEVLSLCDEIVEIPMIGTKKSLNVSVACGIAVYAFSLSSRGSSEGPQVN